VNPGDVNLPRTFSLVVPTAATHSAASVPERPVVGADTRTARFERLLRWYPAEWRKANGAAVVGILLDQADDRGSDRPGIGDSLALAVGGLRESFVAPGRVSRISFGSLTALALLCAFYFGVITWAPGIEFAGTVGPFTNPSIAAGILFVAAFAAALARRAPVSRVLAVVGTGVEVAVGILSEIYGWLGPGWTAVMLFVGLAFFAAFPPQGVRATLWSAFGLVAVVVLVTFVPVVWSAEGLRPVTAGVGFIVLSAITAGGIFVDRRLRRFRSGGSRTA